MSRIRGIFLLIQFSITVALVIFFMYVFRNHAHKVIKIWMKVQIFMLGIKIEEIGKMDESCDLVILNHQSLLDIIVIEYIHNKHLAWVGKKEITDLFFFGHIMKAPNMITINREDKTGIITLLREARDRLDNGRPIAMFPEGTRSDGTKMLSFKSGAKLLANKYNLKVQPIVLFNTRDILDSKKLLAKPGVVKVVYLEPVIADKSTTWFEDTEAKMNEIFNSKIAKND